MLLKAAAAWRLPDKDKGPGVVSLRTVVLLSGTGTNFQAILDRVASGGLNLEVVAALSDRPHAQGLERARKAGLTAIGIPRSDFHDPRSWWDAIGGRLRSMAADLLVLAGFMRILPSDLCEEYRGRALNIHPSLLPRYPGLHTYRRVLKAGDPWHGATVHYVTSDLDNGPRIAQARVSVSREDDEASLQSRIQACEHVLYPRVLEWIAEGRLTMSKSHAILDERELRNPIVFEEQELL